MIIGFESHVEDLQFCFILEKKDYSYEEIKKLQTDFIKNKRGVQSKIVEMYRIANDKETSFEDIINTILGLIDSNDYLYDVLLDGDDVIYDKHLYEKNIDF